MTFKLEEETVLKLRDSIDPDRVIEAADFALTAELWESTLVTMKS